MNFKYNEIDEDLKKLVFDFFYFFSRFEFALKEAESFSKKKGKYGNVEPDWQSFKNRYRDFYSSAALKALLEDPPKEERYIDGRQSIWEPVAFKQTDSDLDKAVQLVKTMRNNLFHGGKSSKEGWDNPQRIQFLLPLGVEILHSFAALDHDLDAHYSYAH